VPFVDRPRAFGELARVFLAGGRPVICTIDPVRIDGFWPARFVASYTSISSGGPI
jgi:hypothetical protein